ncbi:MAG: GNAT family N-acetyltransferase [Rhodanobacteraceae bacterium]
MRVQLFSQAHDRLRLAPLTSSKMTVTVCQAELQDASAAMCVVRRSITELCVTDHHGDKETLDRWLANKTPETFQGWLSNPDNFCVVAESGGDVFGVGLLRRSGQVLLFYLAPGSQRQGIGRAIHVALETRAVQWALPFLQLESTADARRFYEKLGYKATGEPVHKYGVLQCFPYQKHLQPNNSCMDSFCK